MSRYVIFVCPCGNYVAEPTVDAVTAEAPGHVARSDAVICTAHTHGALQPEMRRLEVVEAES